MLSVGAVFLAASLYSIWTVKYHRVFKEIPPVEQELELPSIEEEQIPDSVELLETGQNAN